MRYRLNVISHRVTLILKLRQGPNRGMRYKLEVRVSLREYGILFSLREPRSPLNNLNLVMLLVVSSQQATHVRPACACLFSDHHQF